MIRIAVFVEGQTERKFVKKLIGRRYRSISFAVKEISLRYKNSFIRMGEADGTGSVDCRLLIVEVPSVEKVLSVIRDNASSLVSRYGYERLIGLRDLRPKKRRDKETVIAAIARFLARVPEHDRIGVVVAIMETEAWFLCDWRMFEKMDTSLTREYIKRERGVDVAEGDPELIYDKPSKTMDDILSLVGMRYRKREEEVDQVVNNLDMQYLFSCIGKIDSFFRFVGEFDGCGLLGLQEQRIGMVNKSG
jgi:hypothetical protein